MPSDGRTFTLEDGNKATVAHHRGKVSLTLQTPQGVAFATFTGHELRELFTEAGDLHHELAEAAEQSGESRGGSGKFDAGGTELPTLEQYVAAGYKADTYAAFLEMHEAHVAASDALAKAIEGEPPAPVVEVPVDREAVTAPDPVANSDGGPEPKAPGL